MHELAANIFAWTYHSEDDHRAITKFLKENQIEGYIIPIGVVRSVKVVIRGLPSDIPVENIKNVLTKLDFAYLKYHN